MNKKIAGAILAASILGMIVFGYRYFLEEKEMSENKIYQSFRDFPYNDMEYMNDISYMQLKKIYEEIEFLGEFKTGGEEDLFYLEKFRQMINGELPYVNLETGETVYLNWKDNIRDLEENYTFFSFDMDMNGGTDLCVKNLQGDVRIFRYDSYDSKIILWKEWISPSCLYILGSSSICWDWNGVRHTFEKLDSEGDVEMSVYFTDDVFYTNGKEFYMVTLPVYRDNEVPDADALRKQAYYDQETGLYYFRVTEEQYSELTEEYFKAFLISQEKLEMLTVPVNELIRE